MKPFRGSHVSVGVVVSPERLQLAQVFVLADGATQMMGGLIARLIVLLGAVEVVDDKVALRDQRRRARAFALAGAVIPISADLLCAIY